MKFPEASFKLHRKIKDVSKRYYSPYRINGLQKYGRECRPPFLIMSSFARCNAALGVIFFPMRFS